MREGRCRRDTRAIISGVSPSTAFSHAFVLKEAVATASRRKTWEIPALYLLLPFIAFALKAVWALVVHTALAFVMSVVVSVLLLLVTAATTLIAALSLKIFETFARLFRSLRDGCRKPRQ